MLHVHACINKTSLHTLFIIRVKNFVGSITHKNFLTTKYFQTTVCDARPYNSTHLTFIYSPHLHVQEGFEEKVLDP